MEEWLNQFTQFAEANSELAYLILFVSAFVENVFPPIPGDTFTLLGAYFVGRNSLSFVGVLITTTLGSVLGFMTLFMLAYWLEWKFFEKRDFKWLKKSQVQRVQRWFHKYGYKIVLANRFLSGIRSVISVAAGLTQLNKGLVTLYAGISALLWNGIIIYAGAFVGESWEEILKYIETYHRIFITALVVLGGSYLVYYFLSKGVEKK